MTSIFKIFSLIALLTSAHLCAQLTLSTPNVASVLYLGKGDKQPLIVGLGGSEGGNVWATDHWKETREDFIARGYAFLALGYFGAPGTPSVLSEIAIDDVYQAIKLATKNEKVNPKKIAIIGGSRGADLALLLASHYSDIACVVSIVGSNAVFPGHTTHFSTPCWTYQGKGLPYIPVNEEAIPFLIQRKLRDAFSAMLQDTAAVAKAAIKVEHINGHILFLSAKEDEICPSTQMADAMVARLQDYGFKYAVKHIAIEGGHAAPLKHFDLIKDFLDQHFR